MSDNKTDIENKIDVKELYLTEKEAAAITKDKLPTLRNNRHLRRGIPYLKIGGRGIRYKLSDIMFYMESVRIDPQKQAEK